MYKILLVMLALGYGVRACSEPEGYEPMKLDEIVPFSGAVVTGVVQEVKINDGPERWCINLKNTKWYKGSGPDVIRVNGFTTEGGLCGPSPPDKDTDIILFMCRDGSDWKQHSVGLDGAWTTNTKENLDLIVKATEDEEKCNGCGCIIYSNCTQN